MQKIIKIRLFTWFEEVPNQVQPNGDPVYTERIAHMGDDVDITNDVYVKRGEDLNAFYTDEEADEIRNGTYTGFDADVLARFRSGVQPESPIQPVEGEGLGGNVADMSDEQLAEYIKTNRLTGPDTVALAGDGTDTDLIDKVLDAENIATDNNPRQNVTGPLEKMLADASTSH